MSYKEISNDTIDKSIPTSNTGTWRDTPKRPRTNRLLKDIRDNLDYFEQETIKQEDTTEYTRELLTKGDAEEVRDLLELGSAALASLAQSRGTDIDSVISQKAITEELETLEALIEFNTYFKGKFTSESNLIAATPAMEPLPKYGDFVIVDPGEGIDATFYAWDNDDSKWIEGGHVIDLSVFVTKTQIDTDETLSDDSDTSIPSQKAVKAYVDSSVDNVKTFAPWTPEIKMVTGIDLPNQMKDINIASSDAELSGSTVQRIGAISGYSDDAIHAGLMSDPLVLDGITSLYFKLDGSPEFKRFLNLIGFANAVDFFTMGIRASIDGGILTLESIGIEVSDNTDLQVPITLNVNSETEYCISFNDLDKSLTFYVDGQEISKHNFTTNPVVDTVIISAFGSMDGLYGGDISELFTKTEIIGRPTYQIPGLSPFLVGNMSLREIDETQYPENPNGKGYEIVGLTEPVMYNELGKEVKNGDFIVFDNDGLPQTINAGGVTIKPWTPELSYVPYYIETGAGDDNFAVLLDVTGVTFPDGGYWFAMADSETVGVIGTIHLIHEDGDLVIRQWNPPTSIKGVISGYGEVGGEILIRFEPWLQGYGVRLVTIYDHTGEIFSDTLYIHDPDKSYIAANPSGEPTVDGKGAVTFKILSGVYTSLYEAKNALEEDVIASYTASVNNIPTNATSNIFEITGTPTPLPWDAIGGTVVDGDLVAFDSAGVPFVVDVTAPEEITAARIKQLYESNPDTNAFTDDDVNKLANTTDKTLPINWIEVSTSTFLIEPEHAGKTLWVTADCVITVSAYSTLPTGFNCEILKADSDLIVSIEASGSDTIRDGKSVIVSDTSVFKSLSAGVIGLVGDVQGVNDTVDAPSDGKAYVRKDGAWVEVDQSLPNGMMQPSITGSYITDGTADNALVLTGIVSALALEAGDVIQITGSADGLNDKLFTVETTLDDNSIIVNYEHAGTRGNGSLRLANQSTTVTITRIAKWYNAPTGVGQAWVGMTGSRAKGTPYPNNAGRPIKVNVEMEVHTSDSSATLMVGGLVVSRVPPGDARITGMLTTTVPNGSSYQAVGGGTMKGWWELR